MKKTHHLGLGLLLLACTAGAVRAAESPVESLSARSGPEFDRHYLETMREHHQLGAELASIAEEQAQNQEVSTYAAKASISHELDVKEINRLLDEATPADGQETERPGAQIGSLPTGQSGGAAQDDTAGASDAGAELKNRLESAQGAEFDRTFVEVMTQHENTALEAAKLAQERATRDDVRAFAGQSVQLRNMQLEQLNTLLNPGAAEGQSGNEAPTSDAAQPVETPPAAGTDTEAAEED